MSSRESSSVDSKCAARLNNRFIEMSSVILGFLSKAAAARSGEQFSPLMSNRPNAIGFINERHVACSCPYPTRPSFSHFTDPVVRRVSLVGVGDTHALNHEGPRFLAENLSCHQVVNTIRRYDFH